MALKNSKTVALERRYDLASLFCMIARHGPAVAAATVVLFSVLAAFIIYRIKGKRRQATAENNRFEAEKKDAAVTEYESDPDEELKAKNGLSPRELKENADSIQSPQGCCSSAVEVCHIASNGSKPKPPDTQCLHSRSECQVGVSGHTLPDDQEAGGVPGQNLKSDVNPCNALEQNPEGVNRLLECAICNGFEDNDGSSLCGDCNVNDADQLRTVQSLEQFDQNKTALEEEAWVYLTDEDAKTPVDLLACKRAALIHPSSYDDGHLSEKATAQDEDLQPEITDCLTEARQFKKPTEDAEHSEKRRDGQLLAAKAKNHDNECVESGDLAEMCDPGQQQLQSEDEPSTHHSHFQPLGQLEPHTETSFNPFHLYQQVGEQMYQAICESWGDSVSGKEIEDRYHREIDRFAERLASSINSLACQLDLGKESDELSGMKEKRKDDEEATQADDEATDRKTEISIMDATMDNNEWIAEENNQVYPWMNSDKRCQDLTTAEDTGVATGTMDDTANECDDVGVLEQADGTGLGSNNDPQVVNVTFCVHYFTHSTGQTLAVTGSLQELGCWEAFVPMERIRDGFWVSTPVGLPAESQLEWKFVLLDEGGVCRWEECDNRCLVTGYEGDLYVHKWWGVQ